MANRPLPVTIIGWLFVVFGCIALVAGSYWVIREIQAGRTAQLEAQLFRELIPIGLTWILALIGGAFVLTGHGWARWLLVAWAAFHVVLSIHHEVSELVVHSLVFGAMLYFLFRPDSSRFFRRPIDHVNPVGHAQP